jgi:D-alanine-D-alanine ligase
VLVEAFLPGREFTVGIVGTGRSAQSVGVLEVVLLSNAERDVYSYENKENCELCIKYVRVEDAEAVRAEEVALAAWRGLNCRDGGRVDLRSDADGNPQFLEVNPLAGLHPEHSDLPILCTQVGIPYVELIRRIVDSTVTRVGDGKEIRLCLPQRPKVSKPARSSRKP